MSVLAAALIVAGASTFPLGLAERLSSSGGSHGVTVQAYPLRISFKEVNESKGDIVAQPSPSDAADENVFETEDPVLPEEGAATPPAVPALKRLADGQFARAFADFAKSGVGETYPKTGTADFLRLTYDIEKPRSTSDSIEVKKLVQADGVKKGKVGLRIVNDTTILIDSGAVVSLFGDHISKKTVASLASSSDADKYVDFDTLRAAGIDVRYDAVRDMVLMNSRAS